MTIQKVIENGYCVGCGACKLTLKESVELKIYDDGFYHAKIKENVNTDVANKVCPFSDDADNETEVGERLFFGKKFDERIGYYDDVYVGYVKKLSDRNSSSSGGLTTWFAKKLLLNNEIDAVIHVGHDKNMFDYIITDKISELDIKTNKKSRYYPVSFSGLINEINKSNKRYLFIGVPCFVKSIRLAQQEGMLKNVKFAISLLCGHMKSTNFAMSLAWQVGVKPEKLSTIDFRVKQDFKKANDYNIEVIDIENNKILHQSSSLFGTNWGLGFFKHKSCDFCDDIAGELADATLGDAWLPKYINDSQGTNILVIRNSILNNYLKIYSEEIFIENVDVNDFYESQAGNYRNRREGLLVRIEHEKKWTPRKRTTLLNNNLSNARRKLYLERSRLSRQSIRKFQIAKNLGSIFIFKILMLPDIFMYKRIEKSNLAAWKEIIRLSVPEKIKKLLKKCN
ncbi:Coenzyme F420 hydrogenase/dehydrogenase, beta subunit C-terminal domain [Xenorhabdus sp. TH1]|uniref:Coenzyme F420 hydrogenase/dehydrogenase, beta subunit C-terminal domain n=1 Tax=Xenorhabdus sp. TH1 TaxID=3130166 RepID=UPI0030CD2493